MKAILSTPSIPTYLTVSLLNLFQFFLVRYLQLQILVLHRRYQRGDVVSLALKQPYVIVVFSLQFITEYHDKVILQYKYAVQRCSLVAHYPREPGVSYICSRSSASCAEGDQHRF